jgi:hypothetical protein
MKLKTTKEKFVKACSYFFCFPTLPEPLNYRFLKHNQIGTRGDKFKRTESETKSKTKSKIKSVK